MIGILDISIGNLRSVYNAVDTMGYDVQIVSDKDEFDDLSHLIIPGVGSFFNAIQSIQLTNFREKVGSFTDSGRPVLGICLGMQLLSTTGYEGGEIEGLDLIPGHVEKFNLPKELFIPHVGWNTINFCKEHPVFHKVKNRIDCYFVHSYHFVCHEDSNCFGTTDYGIDFTSIIGKENVLGFQFHPEKSQANGLKLLENFCDWNGKC
ncbi:MAG: imidazole glycerol phosphate synthase subunit HisH [Bacteroidetes bacterium]|nr:imidazole glycerol phosphate synthase subunit HisH [Bacteroidota bacterium]